MRNAWCIGLVLWMLGLTWSTPLAAFQLSSSDWSYLSQPTGEDWRICPANMPGEAVQRTKEGALAWNYAGLQFTFDTEACLSGGVYPRANDVNQIDIGSGLPESVLAKTTRFFVAADPVGETMECDMRFNETINWYTGTDTPASDQSDWLSVALHEMGHCLGLEHENQATPPAVMSATIIRGTAQRQLAPDDLAGRNAIYGSPSIVISPTSADFGAVPLTTSLAKLLTVSNTGDVALEVLSLALAAPQVAEFRLENDTCSGTSLAPTNACTLTVRFTPVTTGDKGTALTVFSTDPDTRMLDVSISGTGTTETCLATGDINQDRLVTPEDARLAFNHFLGLQALTMCESTRANVLNPANSNITPADAQCILRAALGLPPCPG